MRETLPPPTFLIDSGPMLKLESVTHFSKCITPSRDFGQLQRVEQKFFFCHVSLTQQYNIFNDIIILYKSNEYSIIITD